MTTCSHDAWRGNHTTFKAWRRKLAEAAELPPLDLMDGFYVSLAPLNFGSTPTLSSIADKETAERLRVLEPCLPIPWACLKPDVLHELLYVDSFNSTIPADHCKPLAARLEELLPKIPGLPKDANPLRDKDWRQLTRVFIKGLRRAAAAKEPLTFS